MPKQDLQVEEILRDIRLRILNENGADAEGVLPGLTDHVQRTDASNIRINTYLATTDHLRRNLPPVRSERHGAVGRIELWIKSAVERATRWFVFDQVNFNSAVHQVLCELREVQRQQEKILSEVQRYNELEVDRLERNQRLADQEQKEQLRSINDGLMAVSEGLRTTNEEARADTEGLRAINEELRVQINESVVTLDRMRRNFEHRLTELENLE